MTHNHPKPSENNRNFLQPTTNYPILAIMSLRLPETLNNQPLDAFGCFFHLKFWNHTQQSSLNWWKRMNILVFIFTVITNVITIYINNTLTWTRKRDTWKIIQIIQVVQIILITPEQSSEDFCFENIEMVWATECWLEVILETSYHKVTIDTPS